MRKCDMPGCISMQNYTTCAVLGFGSCQREFPPGGTVDQMVHDGDTIKARALGNLNVRFLSVDTPEVSFPMAKSIGDVIVDRGRKAGGGLSSIGQYAWSDYLADPFADGLPPFGDPASMRPKVREYYDGLVDHLRKHASGPKTAKNHFELAMGARDALVAEIRKDIDELEPYIPGLCEENFALAMEFGWEVMDRYGRMLGYVNRYQRATRKNPMPPLPAFYNYRLLRSGAACMYSIWPNVDPGDKSDTVLQILRRYKVKKGTEIVQRVKALGAIRELVRTARREGSGIFSRDRPLGIEPFELRFLGRRSPPDRWVIDLGSEDKVLLHPYNYHKIPNMEDRLFINVEYLPLFTGSELGWKKETDS